jgi:threonine/homoserine/homoserine lactone efflux protein
LSILSYFVQGAALGFTAGVSPGPLQTYLISQALVGGWRRASPIVFAPLITDIPLILISLFILDHLPPYVLHIVSITGGVYVIYLAWVVWKTWRSGEIMFDNEDYSASKNLSRGVLTNFLNPSPYLFWGLVNGPLLISALNKSTLAGVSFLLGFYGIFIATMLVIAGLFGQAKRLGAITVRVLLLVSAIILVIFGGILIYRGVMGIMTLF